MNKELQFLMYHTPEENVSVNAVVKDDTIWLAQRAMAELFDVEVPAVSKHLSNIFEEGELREESTLSKMEMVQQEGTRQVKRKLDFYNLDAIISVGYRVNSRKATQFRIWATGMDEFSKSINEFLAFRKYDILKNKGKISAHDAKAKAESEYSELNKTQRLISDFDREVKKLLGKGGGGDE